MNTKPRERVLMVLDHQEPDRVLVDNWFASEVAHRLRGILEVSAEPYRLEVELGHDLLQVVVGMDTIYEAIFHPELRLPGKEEVYLTEWGIKMKKVSYSHGTYAEIAEYPLVGSCDLSPLRVPDPYQEERYKPVKQFIECYGDDYLVVASVCSGTFEGSYLLRGIENFLVDVAQNKDFAHELIDKVAWFHLEVGKELAELGVDVLFVGDDVGMQTGPLISRTHYKEYVLPHYVRMFEEWRRVKPDLKFGLS